MRILNAVADAFKHAELNNPASRSFVETDEAIICITTGWGEGNFGGVEQEIVETKDGNLRALPLVLVTVRDGCDGVGEKIGSLMFASNSIK